MSPSERLTQQEVEPAVRHVFDAPPFTGGPLDTHGFGELLRSWHEGLSAGLTLQGVVSTVLVGLICAALALGALWVLYLLVHRPSPVPAAGEPTTAVPAPVPAAPPPDPAMLARARVALERERYGTAVELAWQAVTDRLGGTGALTPRQWARWAAAQRLAAEQRPDLVRLLALHESYRYAGQPATSRLAVLAVHLASRLAPP